MILDFESALDQLIRERARKMTQAALDHEVTEFLEKTKGQKTEEGLRKVGHNGHHPERNIIGGAGPLRIRQPRDLEQNPRIQFSSRIHPPFLRRFLSADALIPALYLKGISTGDFSETLEAILGPNAAGLSATNIIRLKEGWKVYYEYWATQDLTDKRYINMLISCFIAISSVCSLLRYSGSTQDEPLGHASCARPVGTIASDHITRSYPSPPGRGVLTILKRDANNTYRFGQL
jgi:transposase-like protein